MSYCPGATPLDTGSNKPQITYVPIQGQVFNKLIQIPPSTTIIVQGMGLGPVDYFALIHFDPITITQDMDSESAQLAPGIQVGQSQQYIRNAAGIVIANMVQQASLRAPMVTFRTPVREFFFTGWAEDVTGTPIDGQWLLVCTNEIDPTATTTNNVGGA